MEWEKIQIQSNCIEYITSNGVLINLPKTSKYKGYSFWHPIKCCRSMGKNNFLLQIVFTKKFKFKLKKYGKGQYNFRQIIDEKDISSDELKKAFGFGISKDLYNELLDNEEGD